MERFNLDGLTEQEVRFILRGLNTCASEHAKKAERTSNLGMSAHESQMASKFDALASKVSQVLHA